MTRSDAGAGAAFGWAVLTLVFVDELAVMGAFGVWGWQHEPRLLLVWLLPVLVATVWATFASPKAPLGGRVLRPVVKMVVFSLGCLALWGAGHPLWAAVLLAFSVVVNALALLPSVRSLIDSAGAGGGAAHREALQDE